MATTDAQSGTVRIDAAALHAVGEHLAAGYMACPDEPPVVRFAQAIAGYLQYVDLPAYSGETLYPCSPSIYARGKAVEWHYSGCMTYNRAVLEQKLEACTDPRVCEALQATDEALRDYPGVSGYTHSIPNYRRILQEGLAGYAERIERTRAIAEARGETDRIDFARAMSLVLDAVRTLHERVLTHVRQAPVEGDEAQRTKDELLSALERVPFEPARSLYEAIVGTNFVLYVDGPDDLGRFDQDLYPFYARDKSVGAISDDQVVAWIRRVWENMDINSAWNVAIGGLLEDGASGVNEVTHLCIKAAEGMRRPNLALRMHEDAPESVFDAALDCIATGGGLPALYNEEAYLAAIRAAHLGVTERDLPDFAFGGCTELMVHGKSNVGSLEGDINLPRILVESLHSRLGHCDSFEQFLVGLKDDLRAHIAWATSCWDANQRRKAQWQPQVVRSLLIDDCIDNGREYNAGGAQYNWCVVNVMGLANIVDSVAALREVVFECREVSAEELLTALEADFEGFEALRERLKGCPHFGNDDDSVDDLAAELSEFVFDELRRYAPWRGGRYVPACLMFVTYVPYGKEVGATPDGRRAGEAIADSAGAMQGRDKSGPTALFRSVSKIRHYLAPGTLVVNARFSKRYFTDEDERAKLKSLIRTYFEMGGMQLQINVVDQDVLRAAFECPEAYGDLIIRVGGYSEYWTRLDDELRRTIIERTEHA